MSRLEAKIPPFEYLKGRDLTNKLKEVVGVELDAQLADVFGVPKGTIATWHQRDLTPYELILRTCLAKNIPLRALALGQGGLDDTPQPSAETVLIARHCLQNGALVAAPALHLDPSLIADADMNSVFAVRAEAATYLFDAAQTHVAAGRYLLNIDQAHSIMDVVRLPGGQLQLQYGCHPVVVDEAEIDVLGKLVATVSKA